MSTKEYALFEVTPEIEQFAKICEEKNAIDKDLYGKYERSSLRRKSVLPRI